MALRANCVGGHFRDLFVFEIIWISPLRFDQQPLDDGFHRRTKEPCPACLLRSGAYARAREVLGWTGPNLNTGPLEEGVQWLTVVLALVAGSRLPTQVGNVVCIRDAMHQASGTPAETDRGAGRLHQWASQRCPKVPGVVCSQLLTLPPIHPS